MNVLKRNGEYEVVSFDKIQSRLTILSTMPPALEKVNIHRITQGVIQGLYDGISTNDIDKFSSEVACARINEHHEYDILAGRILVNNHHKNTLTSFKDKMELLYRHRDNQGRPASLVGAQFYKCVKKYQERIENYIDYTRDYRCSSLPFRTLEGGYLLRAGDRIVERPQDMYMRTAIAIHMRADPDDEEAMFRDIFETYDFMSNGVFIHATPTLFNSGNAKPNFISCFLLGSADSLDGIMKAATDAAKISKRAGGLGLHFNWRGTGSYIRGTGGKSSGIIPFLRIYNAVMLAFNQGGRRKGSLAAYCEMHHPDIMNFLSIRRNNRSENLRCPDLFQGLWVSDLFMERVLSHGVWSLFDVLECPDLYDTYGDEYVRLYTQYEEEKRYTEQIPARQIWQAIYESYKEAGMPYMCFKDAVNRYSNQKNIGTIRSSNLCAEIVEYSDSKEYACCTLANISLTSIIRDTPPLNEIERLVREGWKANHTFPQYPSVDISLLEKSVRIIVRNLNRIIDVNYYQLPETKQSNMRHRPIGIGVQGFANALAKLRAPFGSEEARTFNKIVFERIYFTALDESCRLAEARYRTHARELSHTGETIVLRPYVDTRGKLATERTVYTDVADLPTTIGSYPSMLDNGGAPISKGVFHFEMMGASVKDCSLPSQQWEELRTRVLRYGTYNSLVTACMPAVTTSQILGNSEGIQPLTNNIILKATLTGEYMLVNKYLVHELERIDLWDDNMLELIKRQHGSVKNAPHVPDHIQDLFKTAWEIPQKALIDLAADRQLFVDQSQSLNLHVEDLTFSRFSSMIKYAWEQKLKTGLYYLRTRPAAEGVQVTMRVVKQEEEILDTAVVVQEDEDEIRYASAIELPEGIACDLNTPDCEACSG